MYGVRGTYYMLENRPVLHMGSVAREHGGQKFHGRGTPYSILQVTKTSYLAMTSRGHFGEQPARGAFYVPQPG
jgi:hypothetical protein